ncbi:MAG: RHS repeat-associated core domain-containing protein, partial [Chlorobi bacterium]|nr:RHS repeat-associated core domain-containing protein [Chlorobiota bacterium]
MKKVGGDAYSAPVVAVKEGSTTTYFYLLRDYLGNITHQVNTLNTVVAEYNFDAWGRRRNATNWSYTLDSNDKDLFAGRGFTAHETLPWFKLVNMNGRLYHPVVGRFLSPDNYVQSPDFTQSYNRYSYCLNNPLSYTGPSGNYRQKASTND